MPHCLFCKSNSYIEFQAFEKMLGLGDEFCYQECNQCKSLQISSIPEDLSRYYSSETYYSFSDLIKSGRLMNFLKQIRMRLFLLTGLKIFMPSYGHWLRQLRPRFDHRIVDVGCGSGQLIYELWASGFRNLVGIDPFISKSKKIEKGCELIKGHLSKLNERADIIMMHHAFEHMADPEKVLDDCKKSLKPKGQLLIRTPLASSAAFREFRENWVQLDAPRHLVIPSVEGFKILAESKGFKVKEILFDSTEFQFWGSELYMKDISLNGATIKRHFSKRKLNDFRRKARAYNEQEIGDQVCFYLEAIH